MRRVNAQLTHHELLSIMVSMNRLSTAKRVAVVSALVEGCSIRSTVRMTGVSKNTIAKLLVELGAACRAYQDETLRNLPLQARAVRRNLVVRRRQGQERAATRRRTLGSAPCGRGRPSMPTPS